MAELKADVLVLGCGHGRRRRRPAPAKAGPGRGPDRPARARRRGDQLRQRRTDRMRVGVSLHVSPGSSARSCDTRPIARRRCAISFSDLPAFLPWLVRYFLASSPERALHSAMAELPLIQRSLIEHEALIAEANVPELLRRTGWIKLFRSEATLANAVRDLERARAIWRRGRDSRRRRRLRRASRI